MKTWNPNKRIKIEIYAPEHPANGYTIWDISNKPNHAITRLASEDDIFDMLTENEYRQFENGKYTFRVSAQQIADKFQYLYS